MPTPLVVAGGALCLLGGYLVGAVTAPDTPSRTTATVDSYDPSNGRLCLSGENTADQPGAGSDGQVCGTWRSAGGDRRPVPGDTFRFVVVSADNERSKANLIYGNIVN